MDGVRTLLRLTTVALVGALAALLAALLEPSPAWARADPPDVRGLSVDEARTQLEAWSRTVRIIFVPALEQLPRGIDRSTVVVSESTWLNPTTGEVVRPQMRLALGTRVPDLSGLTRDQADQALTIRGLRLRSAPDPVSPEWVATSQQPPPLTVVAFGFTVSVDLGSPDGMATTDLVVLVGGAAVALGLLILIGVLTARQLRRRRPTAPTERIEVRSFAGQVVGPDLSEPTPGASLSVRLEPHYDRGTFSLEEGRR